MVMIMSGGNREAAYVVHLFTLACDDLHPGGDYALFSYFHLVVRCIILCLPRSDEVLARCVVYSPFLSVILCSNRDVLYSCLCRLHAMSLTLKGGFFHCVILSWARPPTSLFLLYREITPAFLSTSLRLILQAMGAELHPERWIFIGYFCFSLDCSLSSLSAFLIC